MAKRIVVGIGEYQLAVAPDVLAVIGLGSCVAVILYDPQARLAGLAHIMLPDSSIARQRDRSSARFADVALKNMLNELTRHGARQTNLVAHIVGGADILSLPTSSAIGQRNIQAIKNILRDEGIFIATQDLGGHQSRSLEFDVASGRLTMRISK